MRVPLLFINVSVPPLVTTGRLIQCPARVCLNKGRPVRTQDSPTDYPSVVPATTCSSQRGIYTYMCQNPEVNTYRSNIMHVHFQKHISKLPSIQNSYEVNTHNITQHILTYTNYATTKHTLSTPSKHYHYLRTSIIWQICSLIYGAIILKQLSSQVLISLFLIFVLFFPKRNVSAVRYVEK